MWLQSSLTHRLSICYGCIEPYGFGNLTAPVLHLCRVFEGGQHVVLESSQTMNDIPFGDHFTVESRWDFSARPPRADGTAQTLVGLPAGPAPAAQLPL